MSVIEQFVSQHSGTIRFHWRSLLLHTCQDSFISQSIILLPCQFTLHSPVEKDLSKVSIQIKKLNMADLLV